LVARGRKAKMSEEEKSEEDDLFWNDLFLYKDDPDVFPVIEYEPIDKFELSNLNLTPDKNTSPHYINFSKDNDVTITMFYAPWCPHCQHMKPMFIKIAKELNDRVKSDKISFLAVSCEVHQDICMTYNVNGYPLIRGFRRDKDDAISQGMTLNDGGEDDPPLTADLVGKYLNLDLALKRNVTINHSDESYQIKLKKDSQMAESSTKEQLKEHEYKRSLHDVYSDAGKSFIFNIRNGIHTTNEDFSVEAEDSLTAWIKLLLLTIPESWGLRSIIKDLDQNFEEIIQSKTDLLSILDRNHDRFYGIYDFPGSETNKHVFDISELQKLSWSYGCSHGKRNKGYTCGLWELFHIITIGVSEHYTAFFDYQNHNGRPVTTKDIAETINNFIWNFFICDVCRKHFVKMYDSCGFDHCTRLHSSPLFTDTFEGVKELSIWLWEVHNGVNVRLIGERAKRQGRNVTQKELDAALWPTPNMCPNCRYSDGTWNKQIVFKFLRWRYWPGYDSFSLESNTSFSAITLPILFSLFAVKLFSHFFKKWNLKMSGRHKKIDLEIPNV